MFEKFFNENYLPPSVTEDKVLDPLLEELDEIVEPIIKSFARAILLGAPEWFWTAPPTLERELAFEDEAGEGGLIVHLRRTIKIFELLAMTANLTPLEIDKGKVAVLLGQMDKYHENDGELTYNLWAAFSIANKIDSIVKFNELWGKENESNTVMLKPEIIEEIKRLIRVQDGKWTPVPEIRPQSTLELVYHQSLYIASGLKQLVEHDTI